MGGSVVFGDVTPHTEKWVSQIFYGLACMEIVFT